MIRGIHHVALSTPDLDRLIAFYVDGLGFEVVMEAKIAERPIVDQMIGLDGVEFRQAMLKAGNCYVEVFEYTSPTPVPKDPNHPASNHGYTHFCLDVVDIDAEYERLSNAGMTFHRPPPTVDEIGGSGVLRAIYGRDPDGNIIELQEVLEPRLPFSLEQTSLAGPTLKAATA